MTTKNRSEKAKSKHANDVRLSKSLSWLLRHGAEKEGFTLDENGYLYVEDLLKHKTFKNYSVNDVERVVSTNSKQRFSLHEDPTTGKLRIRANQGHSIEVTNLQLTPIIYASSEPLVMHGTYEKNMETIKTKGLSRMKRNHIHFSTGFPGEEVISGVRNNCDVFIVINLKKALEDGISFFKSANGVILSPGNREGILEPRYFSEIISKKQDEKKQSFEN